MWEMMELSVAWQQSVYEAQRRAWSALADGARAGAATTHAADALVRAGEANRRALSGWLSLWKRR